MSIPLPTLTITPSNCYTTTWKVFSKADNTDMTDTFPSTYRVDAPNLVISHTVPNFNERHNLVGQHEFYFVGTTNTTPTPTVNT